MSPAWNRRGAPSPLLTVLETRSLAELGSIAAAGPLLERLHHGDGHPVLVLPGFTATDRSTAPLRRILRSQGYVTNAWRLGPNLGPTPRVVAGLADRLADIHERHGRPVSLIGWSLGGIYARELARAFPGQVRQVVTLGSPFRMTSAGRSAASALYERLGPLHAPDRAALPPESRRPRLEVPATAIYTKSDGIVPWQQCLESDGPMRENIRVLGSHSGLGFNPAVVYAVADRLAQPAGQWRPFQPPAWSRAFYPRPVAWRGPSRPHAA